MHTSFFFGGILDREGLSLDFPACHPAEKLVVVAAQPNIKIPGRALHLLDPGSEEEIVIMDDLSKLPGLYSWNSDGSRLVFQMDQLTGMGNDIEWTWNRASGEIIRIAQGYKFQSGFLRAYRKTGTNNCMGEKVEATPIKRTRMRTPNNKTTTGFRIPMNSGLPAASLACPYPPYSFSRRRSQVIEV